MKRQSAAEVWVLFPMASDAQKVSVTIDEDNRMIYQGDIIIAPSQIVTSPDGTGTRRVDIELNARRLTQSSQTRSAGMATWGHNWGRWPEGVIPYAISNGMPQKYLDLISTATTHINSKTHLCLRRRERGEDDYVEYVPVEGVAYNGQSSLGKVGGRQEIRLNIRTAVLKTAVHETLHAAGFIHEHNRSDRDDYVRIIDDNIIPGRGQDFEKDPVSENYTEYDFNSVMHYRPDHFGIVRNDGSRRTTIKPRNPRTSINPSSTLTALDIKGVNTAYPFGYQCDERRKMISINDLDADGRRSNLSNETVSEGWHDAEPVVTNGAVSHMMFLNNKSDSARVRVVAGDGTLGEVGYSEEWEPGWEDLEMYYADNTTYILQHRRFRPLPLPGNPGADMYEPIQGVTRITKVRSPFRVVRGRRTPVDPFGDGLGDMIYESVWGSGWNVIKFYHVGNSSFLFRHNVDGTAQIYRINSQAPFANGRLGTQVYNEDWARGWNIVRFFLMGGLTYCLRLKTETGKVRINQMNATGAVGDLRFEGEWRTGWDNVNIFNHPDGSTYLLTLKSSDGQAAIHRFKADDPFSARTPYEQISEHGWGKGWTHSKIYLSPGGYKLLLMKR